MITDLFRSPAERRQAEEFADLLDGRRAATSSELEPLLALTASLRTAETAPSSDFRTALRARLVEETAQRSPSVLVPNQRMGEVVETRSHRIRQAVAAMTVVTLVGGVGAAAASTSALPGDSLYGLKRGLESVQLKLASSDLARGRELLEQADARLGEAERLAGSDDATDPDIRGQISRTLVEMDAALRAASTLLTEVYAQTGDVAALELLDRFVIDQQRRLDLLLDRLASIDPALRDEADETAALLATLHAEVTALIRPAGEVTSSSATSGAARDPRSSGDGWEVGRASDYLVPNQTLVGGTGSSPSSGTSEQTDPAATDGTGTGLVDELADGAVLDTPDITPPVLPDPGTTVVVPTVPVPEASVATLPVETPDLPCVPVAPLTTC